MHLRFGGDFVYDPESDTPSSALLLVGGGVGINPLLSMIKEAIHFDSQHQNTTRPIALVYSAAKVEDLLFKVS